MRVERHHIERPREERDASQPATRGPREPIDARSLSRAQTGRDPEQGDGVRELIKYRRLPAIAGPQFRQGAAEGVGTERAQADANGAKNTGR